ncbi:MAG: hypothetical protein ACRD04_10890 [Terriglobales bacterium]
MSKPDLTSAQRRFLQSLTEDPRGSAASICERAGVSTSSYYAWCQQPEFRALLTRIWTQAFFANAWQMLNELTRYCTYSPGYAAILVRLMFSPEGQAALRSWQDAAAPAMPTPPPARIAEHLAQITAAAAAADTPSVQSISEQAQQVTDKNCIEPASPVTDRLLLATPDLAHSA